MKRLGYGLVVASLAGASLCSTGKEPVRDDPGAAALGYVLFSPLVSTASYLIDKRGRVVHAWDSDFAPGASVHLLDNGHLLRPARDPGLPFFSGGGQGGRIQEFTWEGRLLWDFVVGGLERMPHHDICPLPNGNVLAIVWERKSREQAIHAGRRTELVTEAGLWPDCVLEIAPRPPAGGEIVWDWHVWDHLIQDRDPERPGYGRVSDHPELVDINGAQATRRLTDEALERLQALGYVLRGGSPAELRADFLHTNSIAYHPSLDQIALSVSRFGELWVIDHGTTSAEAAGHSGGRAGRGGDLLYRWGNPRAYGRGLAEQQRLFGQHDARWIPPGLPGAGNLTVFDNGDGRPGGRLLVGPRDHPATRRRGRLLAPARIGVRSRPAHLDVHRLEPPVLLRGLPLGRPAPSEREHLDLLGTHRALLRGDPARRHRVGVRQPLLGKRPEPRRRPSPLRVPGDPVPAAASGPRGP